MQGKCQESDMNEESTNLINYSILQLYTTAKVAIISLNINTIFSNNSEISCLSAWALNTKFRHAAFQCCWL